MKKLTAISPKLAIFSGFTMTVLATFVLFLQWNASLFFISGLTFLNICLILLAHILLKQDINHSQQRTEHRLLESEQRYRRIFENTSDSLLVCDLDTGLIIEANSACCQLFGYTQQELVGHTLSNQIDYTELQAFDEFIEKAKSGTQLQGQFRCLTSKRGVTFHSQILVTTLTYQNQPYFLFVIRDITQQIEAYQLLEQRVIARTSELSTLLEISQQIVATLDIKVLENILLNQLKRLVNYSGVILFTHHQDNLKLLFKHLPVSEKDAQLLVSHMEHSAVTNLVLKERKPVIISDVRGDTPLAKAVQQELGNLLTTSYSYARSHMLVPLVIKENVIGVISLVYNEPNYYTEQHADLALTIGNQVAITLENIELYRQALELAAMQERHRLARELHDSTAQVLYSVLLVGETARAMLEQEKRESAALSNVIGQIVSLAEGGLEEMRTLIYELRPETLVKEGLGIALEKQVNALRARHGINVKAQLVEIKKDILSNELEEAIYWIAREALHNVVKHSHATLVTLSLQFQDNKKLVILQVCDNGRGFMTDNLFPGHLGLTNIRERVAQLAGKLLVESAPGAGTSLCVELPLGKPSSIS